MFARCSNTVKARSSRVARCRTNAVRRITQKDLDSVRLDFTDEELDNTTALTSDIDVYAYQHVRKLRHHGSVEHAVDYIQEFKGLSDAQKAEKQKLYKQYFDAQAKLNEDTSVNMSRALYDAQGRVYNEDLNEPVRVAVTGAAGQIGYALLVRIATGSMFGPNTPVILQLLDIPEAQDALKGVVMELKDCAFPLVAGITASSVPEEAFADVDYAMLVGAKPRGPGMERGDLLKANGKIFVEQGAALDAVGKGENTRVVVVGNPANTNALIAAHSAKSIPAANFAAMTKLDHNRGLSQLATKIGCKTTDINRFVIWGNHSATQFPDIFHATVGEKLVTDLVDNKWYLDTFVPSVQQRGAAIIKARGLSSAASAASALCDNVREWHLGTGSKWTSVAVPSTGEYGVTEGLFYSYPVVYQDRQFDVVQDLPITEASAKLMEATHKELLQERDAVADLLR